MPSSVASLMAAAGLAPEGSVQWGTAVPSERPGIYVVAIDEDPGSIDGALAAAPLSNDAIAHWLQTRPELRLDGRRPDATELRQRLAEFWLPDETVLYIGLTTRSLRKRVAEYYKTPLGARKPHAGGHFLKTLTSLNELHVHFAASDAPAREDNELVASFLGRLELECGVVSLTYERAELSGRRGSQVVHPRANAA